MKLRGCVRATPPNTPQRHRNEERQRQRDARQILTPEHHRIPNPSAAAPPIPFALAPARLPAPAPAPAVFNGRTYQHLDPALAAQLAALPPMPNPVHPRGRMAANAVAGPSRIPPAPVLAPTSVPMVSLG